jgi:hypothetical protein
VGLLLSEDSFVPAGGLGAQPPEGGLSLLAWEVQSPSRECCCSSMEDNPFGGLFGQAFRGVRMRKSQVALPIKGIQSGSCAPKGGLRRVESTRFLLPPRSHESVGRKASMVGDEMSVWEGHVRPPHAKCPLLGLGVLAVCVLCH